MRQQVIYACFKKIVSTTRIELATLPLTKLLENNYKYMLT